MSDTCGNACIRVMVSIRSSSVKVHYLCYIFCTLCGVVCVVKGLGPNSTTDVDNLLGLLETIAQDGKIAVQWEDADNTIKLVAIATSDMLNLYGHFPEMLFMDGLYVTLYNCSIVKTKQNGWVSLEFLNVLNVLCSHYDCLVDSATIH